MNMNSYKYEAISINRDLFNCSEKSEIVKFWQSLRSIAISRFCVIGHILNLRTKLTQTKMKHSSAQKGCFIR